MRPSGTTVAPEDAGVARRRGEAGVGRGAAGRGEPRARGDGAQQVGELRRFAAVTSRATNAPRAARVSGCPAGGRRGTGTAAAMRGAAGRPARAPVAAPAAAPAAAANGRRPRLRVPRQEPAVDRCSVTFPSSDVADGRHRRQQLRGPAERGVDPLPIGARQRGERRPGAVGVRGSVSTSALRRRDRRCRRRQPRRSASSGCRAAAPAPGRPGQLRRRPLASSVPEPASVAPVRLELDRVLDDLVRAEPDVARIDLGVGERGAEPADRGEPGVARPRPDAAAGAARTRAVPRPGGTR